MRYVKKFTMKVSLCDAWVSNTDLLYFLGFRVVSVLPTLGTSQKLNELASRECSIGGDHPTFYGCRTTPTLVTQQMPHKWYQGNALRASIRLRVERKLRILLDPLCTELYLTELTMRISFSSSEYSLTRD